MRHIPGIAFAELFWIYLLTPIMSVFLTDLDDFIAPGQACVNPLVVGKSKTDDEKSSSSTGARITLESDFSTSEFGGVQRAPLLASEPNLIRTKGGLDNSQKVATVSLNDCLACSGCVTTAETVLIQQQSTEKLMEKLFGISSGSSTDDDVIVLAISPQSRASIAHKLGMQSSVVFLYIATVLKQMGVKYVVDSSSAGDVALIEAREEFLHKYRGTPAGSKTSWEKPGTTVAVSSTRINMDVFTEGSSPTLVGPPNVSSRLPMIVSSCPGWVCYAEKTQPQAIPLMSSTKSAQQILGSVFKKYFGNQAATATAESSGSGVYMISIQPCFDKKLEASRLDFYDDSTDDVDVDLVLSTTELWNILESQAILGNFPTINEYFLSLQPDNVNGSDEVEALFRNFSVDGQILVSSDSDTGSGGHMDYMIRYMSETLFGKNLWEDDADKTKRPKLDFKVGRNPDIAELNIFDLSTSTDDNEPKKLKFAKVYGFRNIQSVMMKLKRGKCEYDFMEVMACPSGCVNGGGQLRIEGHESSQEGKERIKAVEKEYHTGLLGKPDDSPLVKFLYSDERLGQPLSEEAKSLLHTRHHAIPKLEEIAPLAAKW